MTPEQHARVQSIFLAASKHTGVARQTYLDDACGTDADLRREVEELLSFHTTATVAETLTKYRNVVVDIADQVMGPFARGTVLDGKIRVDEVLGEGGMGTVFRAYQLALERPVAIKIIRPSLIRVPGLLERLRREALAVARLRHPNVVAIHDFCSSDDVGAYLVMELVAGEPLADTIRRTGPMAPAFAVPIVEQIAAAVHAAHEVGVIHRDLKPHNILLEPPEASPRVKVLDFGIAKLIEDSTASQTLVTDGGLVGTPLYISPEQASGVPCDARADIYSLGCILYELVAGRTPFVSANVARLLFDHMTSTPKPPSEYESTVPAWLDAVVLRALKKDPDDRFASAAELATALVDGLRESTEPRVSGAFRPIAATRPPNNLPVPATSFVGRERDVDEVLGALDVAPLVTLTGLGGVGKTRLAIHAAGAILDRADCPEQCWFVDLAPVTAPTGVARAVASTLGLRAESDETAGTEIARQLGERAVLLVLDNCEHVVAAAAELLATLVAECPNLSTIATSRATLHVTGEAVHSVDGLSLPDRSLSADEAASTEAVVLFAERARLISTAFTAEGDDVEAIADICRQLDGLPLAIELAAARSRILTVHQIRDRLRDRLRLLKSTGTPGRHESLRAAIDWSYDLLGEPERVLFERLSVFSGGFTIDAIESICTDDDLDAVDALDILSGLVDKSLVGVTHVGKEARYLLLETVREYAMAKLAERGDVARLRERHRDHFLTFAELAATKQRGNESAVWGVRLQTELNNLRAALAFSRDEPGDGVTFLRFAKALHVFFYERGYLVEGRAWIEAALERAGDAAPAGIRSVALAGVGNLAHDQGDLVAARDYHERSLALDRVAGDPAGIAAALHNVGNILLQTSDFEAARVKFEESLAYCRVADRPHNVALSLYTQASVATEIAAWDRAAELLAESDEIFTSIDYTYGLSLVAAMHAYTAMVRGDLDRIDALLDDALKVARSVGNGLMAGNVTTYRANVESHRGRLDDAEAHGAEALAELRALGYKDPLGLALFVLARVARLRGEPALAADRLSESLVLRSYLGSQKGMAECFEEIAALASERDPRAAARLLGAASAIRERIGAPIPPLDGPARTADRDAVRAAAGDGEIETGAGLSTADALTLARRTLAGY